MEQTEDFDKINLTQFKTVFGRKALGELAESVDTSLDYLELIIQGVRQPGIAGKKNLVAKLVDARPDLFSRESLRPDVFL